MGVDTSFNDVLIAYSHSKNIPFPILSLSLLLSHKSCPSLRLLQLLEINAGKANLQLRWETIVSPPTFSSIWRASHFLGGDINPLSASLTHAGRDLRACVCVSKYIWIDLWQRFPKTMVGTRRICCIVQRCFHFKVYSVRSSAKTIFWCEKVPRRLVFPWETGRCYYL